MSQWLDTQWAWRFHELANTKLAVQRLSNSRPLTSANRMQLRAAVVLLYAHWEGFVRESCECYFEYVSRRRLVLRDLADPFVLQAMDNLVSRKRSGDVAAGSELVLALRSGGNHRVAMKKKGAIDTRNNLRYEVLRDVLNSVGLDSGAFETKKNLIDVLLCDARNAAAHGREELPDASSYLDVHDHVIAMLGEFKSSVESAAHQRSYAYRA